MDRTTDTPVHLMCCFSSIQIWHLADEFYLVRNFKPEHLVCRAMQTPLILNFYCSQGDMMGYIDKKAVALHKNEALILLPEQKLSITRLSDDFCCTLFAMSRNMAEAQNVGEEYLMYENIRQQPILAFDDEMMHGMLSLTDTYIYTIRQQNNPRQREILLLLLRVNHLLHAGTLHQKRQETQTNGQNADSISIKFNRLVEAHHSREHKVAFYADKLCLTPKYLSTVVKQTSGHPAGWWIDYLLTRDAERYLLTTDMPVQQIAAALGFSSQSAFGKYFRRQKGMSPKNFRLKNSHPNN